MDFDKLKKVLTLDEQGNINLSKGSLGANVDDLINTCYNNSYNNNQTSIIIHNASVSIFDNAIELSGNSEFLNADITTTAELPVKGSFFVDHNGNVQLLLRYTLLDAAPGPNAWKFSSSFPNLPTVTDWSKPIRSSSILFLDELYLFNTSFVVTTQAQTDKALNIPLEVGINFVSQLKPKGILGILEDKFNQGQSLNVYGQILLPQVDQVTAPREASAFPWEVLDIQKPPGIMLDVDLMGINLGSNTFEQFKLKIYSPISEEWLEKNPTQTPLTSFAVALYIPGNSGLNSSGIKIDLIADYEIGAHELYFTGIGHNLNIANLADMVNISGSSDNESFLPDELQKLIKGLSQIELQSVGLGLSMKDSSLKVTSSMFSVGLSSVDWEIWQGHFALTDLGCRFEISNPFDKLTRQMEVTLTAKVEIEGKVVNAFASSRDQFTFYASLADVSIPIGSLLNNHGLSVESPSDLVVNSLRVGIAPMKSYSFALFMAEEPNTWTIDLGPKTLMINDVTLDITYPKGGPLEGNFGGTLIIENLGTFSCNYSLSRELMAYTSIPQINLGNLIDSLNLIIPVMPEGLSFELNNSYAMVHVLKNSSTFLLSTELDNYGAVIFQALKSSESEGKWGFVFGLNLGSGSISAINGLSALEPLVSIFTLQELVLVLSSFDSVSFSFPGLEDFNQPAIAARGINLPSQSDGIIAGLNVHGQWKINTEDKKQKILKEILGLDPTLGVTLQVGANPAKNASLYASYSGYLMNMPLQCTVGARMCDSRPEFFLSGTLVADIQGSKETFTVTTVFTPNGVFASGSMQGSNPVDFKTFKLGDLALEMGISYEGIPALGLAGTIIVENFMSSIAVFFDSAMPSHSMVAGAVSDLHLGDVLETLTGGGIIPSEIDSVLNSVAIEGTKTFDIDGAVVDNLKQRDYSAVAEKFVAAGVNISSTSEQILIGEGKDENTWFVTDLANDMRHYQLTKKDDKVLVEVNAQFYCAPQDTSIGENMHFPEGFYISGKIEFLGIYVAATIEISEGKGIAIDAQMSKVVLGNENLFSIKAAEGEDGPRLSIATYSQPDEEVKKFRDPHFYINGEINLLGIKESIFINITSSGAKFDIEGDLLPDGVIKGKIQGSFDSLTNASVTGDINIGIEDIDLGALGKYSIDTGATGALEVFIKGSDLGAAIKAGFELAGDKFDLPEIKIDVNTGNLEELPSMLYDAIKEFLEDLFEDAEKWAKYAKDALNWTEDEISSVLESEFGLNKDEVKKILNVLLCPISAALNAL